MTLADQTHRLMDIIALVGQLYPENMNAATALNLIDLAILELQRIRATIR